MLPQAGNSWTPLEAAHLLNRAGFSANPDEIKTMHALGRAKAVDSLLNPTESLDAFPRPDWASKEQALADMRMRLEQRREIQKKSRGLSAEETEKLRRLTFQEMQRENRQHALESQDWWFRRMLKTKAPLREKMTLFWHDHFSSSVQKVKQPVLMLNQNELFRRHAFGSFKSLTQEVLMDPAMMLYLDTQSSKKGQPNENFAREVMELFTLGEGTYTEEDIHDAARAFTGYSLNRLTGEVFHNRRQWDGTPKTVFGKTGDYNGKDIINLIFEKPEAAKFMAKKIWEFFVYDNPPDSAVKMLAETLREADYALLPLLREMFLSKEFYSEASIRSQIKCPVQFIIALLKQLEITEPPSAFPITAQQQLGQILFMPPNVAGWDWGQAWINTNTLLTRYNLCGFLTKGVENTDKMMGGERIKAQGKAFVFKRGGRGWNGPDYEKIAPRTLRSNPIQLVDSLIHRFFQGPVPDKARDSFIAYAHAKNGVIFTDKETAELCHLILSTPYYQLC